jgi:polyisoprenoid-binding protein YceI
MSTGALVRSIAVAIGAALLCGSGPSPTSAQDKPGAKAGPESGKYEIDAVHSAALFRVKHLNVAWAYGRFDKLGGKIEFDAADPSKSSIQIAIDAASVSTANADRDTHLRGPDFFNVAEHPQITFESDSIVVKGPDQFEVTGAFAMHGAEETVTVPVELTGHGSFGQFGTRLGFEARFTIQRSAFGMDYQLGTIGDDVTIVLSIEAIKK